MNSTLGTLTVIDMPLLLIAVGLIVIALVLQLRARRSMSWPSTTGVVNSATIDERVKTGSNGTSTLYCPMIAYEYEVDGHHYMQNRLLMGGPVSSRSRSRVQKWVDRYPEGSAVKIYYNPADPSESVLERKANGPVMILWGMAAILVLVAIGAGVMIERGAH